MSKLRNVALPALIAGFALGAAPALANCANQICVSGSDDYHAMMHTVQISTQADGFNFFFVEPPDPRQVNRPSDERVRLAGSMYKFPVKLGLLYTFAVQACITPHGPCLPWTAFSHRVQADQ